MTHSPLRFSARWETSAAELVLFSTEPREALAGILEEIGSGAIEDRELTKVSEHRLESFQSPSIVLQGLDALSLLTDLPDSLASRASDSLRALVECSKFLLELLCHGQFLPILHAQEQENTGRFQIRWETAFGQERFREKFKILAASLPRVLSLGLPTPEKFLQQFLIAGTSALAGAFAPTNETLREQLDSESDELVRSFLQLLAAKGTELPLLGNSLHRTLQSFHSWGANFRISEDRPELRLLLKLQEPGTGGFWKLDIGLSVALVPEKRAFSQEIVAGKSSVLERMGFSVPELDEILLRKLIEAERSLPLLRRALERQTVGSIKLTTEEAYDLLAVHSDGLIRGGVMLELPPWWSRSRSRLSLSLKLSPKESAAGHRARGSMLGLGTLVQFEWGIALDDQELTADEFELIVNAQKPLVFLRGRWVELNADKLSNSRKLLQPEKRRGEMRLVDALRRGANLEDEGFLPVQNVEAEGWLRPLLTGGEGGMVRREQPEKFLGELREYQRKGLDWLSFLSDAGIGGCLADDMGLGKTVQFLALLLAEREDEEATIGPTLLVVPMSILGNWKRECDRFAPSLRVLLHHGGDRMIGDRFREAVRASDIVLSTYAIAHRDEELFRSIEWHRIALDEAQSIKNSNTKQSRSVKRLIEEQFTLVGRSRPVERVALTGTPLENHLEELFSIFDFLNPGYLGTIAEFRRNFSVPVERFRDRDRAQALAQLIRPLMLRRLKSDPLVITDLPEKIEMEEIVPLTSEQAALYQGVIDELLPQVEHTSGIHRKGLILSVLTRLKQICNDPALFLGEAALRPGRSGKTERLRELIETILDEGDVTLIFSQYAKMGDLLSKYLAETFNQEVLFFHGSLSRSAREDVLKRFNDERGPRIFVLSLKAGGFGLNLTRANQVIHFDQWWNPAVENQATDRAHRIGQTRSVQVRRLLCQGTLEERIAALSQEKRDLAEQVLGSTREYLTELSSEDLRKLLELSVSSIREDPL